MFVCDLLAQYGLSHLSYQYQFLHSNHCPTLTVVGYSVAVPHLLTQSISLLSCMAIHSYVMARRTTHAMLQVCKSMQNHLPEICQRQVHTIYLPQLWVDCYPDQDTLQPQGGFKMIDSLQQVIQCPLCSAKIRRQGLMTIDFVNRFVTHVRHYHGRGEEE